MTNHGRFARSFLAMGSIVFGSGLVLASSINDRPVDTHYCPDTRIDKGPCYYNEAVGFEDWGALTPRQQEWLEPLVAAETGGNPAATFAGWADQNNDRAAAFLSITHALSRLTLLLPSGTKASGLDLVVGIHEIQGDRIEVSVDPDLRDAWRNNGGKFTVALADGDIQDGSMNFADHTVLGGGELISGFDLQWFSGTTSKNSPRFHFNFRLSDNSADMHLDVAVWIWGFIPNPVHLTYAGSDPRQYYGDYTDRYGAPGYQVQQRVVPKVKRKGLP